MIGRLALACALAVLGMASLRTPAVEVAHAQQLTSTPTPTATPAAAGPTAAAIASPVALPSQAPLATPRPSPEPTARPTATRTPQPTSTRVVAMQATLGPILSATPTRSPTWTPTPFLTPLVPATPIQPQASSTGLPNTAGLAPAGLTPISTPVLTPVGAPVPNAALATNLATSSITRSSATVTWTSSVPTTSQVEYGTVADNTFRSPLDPSLLTAHTIVLTGLLPGTTYQFHALGATPGGTAAISTDGTFVTAPDGSGPEVAALTVEQATGTLARVGWTTSTGTVAQVEYGTTANYGSFTLLKVYGQPAQDMLLSGLLPATTYHYRVKAWDPQGGLGASADATFSTAPAGLANLIGDDTVRNDSLSLPGGQAVAYQYVAAQSGLASVVRVYVDAGSAAPALRVALYSDQTGAPGAILSQGTASGLSPGWTSVTIPPVPLLRSTRYWIGVLSPLGPGALNVRQSTSGGSSLSSTQTSLAAFPQPFGSGVPGARSPLAAYVQQVPPAITLTGPPDGSVVSGQAQLSAVVDDDAPVTRLQFYIDAQAVGAPLTSAPFTLTWSVDALNAGLPHTISARASDALGRSSVSGSVNVQVDNGPVISNVVASPGLTASSARVTWTTDVPADGQVEYGPTTNYGLTTPLNSIADVRHDMQLTGLSDGTTYHYRVRSRDAAGALTLSPDATLAPVSEGT
ncbi:MAG: hypothetical protein JOZ87_16935 [Chloroflexi bacterium]|nr:hypothetical protein [Chloroflexota bacterium]